MSHLQDLNNELKYRLERWIHASYGLGNLEIYATINVQEIGRPDCICIAEDNRICSSLGNNEEAAKNLLRDNDHF